jgi:hypothetical protein
LGCESRAGQVLAQAVVEVLSQTSPFAIRHLRDFLVQSLSLTHFALQRRRPFLDASIQLPYQGAKLGQHPGKQRIRGKSHHCIPKTESRDSGCNV